MGQMIDEALEICNTGEKMLRLAEKIEEGEIEVEGEKMVLTEEFKFKLQVKYDGLKIKIKEKIEDKEI